MSFPSSLASLRDFYGAESAKIRGVFEATGDGLGTVRARSALMDIVVTRLYDGLFPLRPGDFCLVALGGYGRQVLFPHSDIDLLFLSADERIGRSHQNAVAAMVRLLWDLPLRLYRTSRTLAECSRFHPDNLEFSISLLDCRRLAGDASLFDRLRTVMLPGFVARERSDLLHHLAVVTRRRHVKHDCTIHHLEPNLKEAPGGLRDYHVASWLTLIVKLGKERRWVIPESAWPVALREEASRALEFLSSTRCFLHYRRGRDDNQLTYELQAEAASAGIGHRSEGTLAPADWMQSYFRHARAVARLTEQLLEEVSTTRSSLYARYQDWRSRLSNTDFSVLRDRIYPRQPAALADPVLLLRLFEMMARHGLALSRDAERAVEKVLSRLAVSVDRFPGLWPCFRQILLLPHAADALRAMHRLDLLATLFPQFRAIDALVIRDFYHRYTVDEHSFLTIQNLHRLRTADGEWERRFAEILAEVEQPELLFFCLLFHDVGKGMPHTNHIQASLDAVEEVISRLALPPADRKTVRFLISNHLAMSATLLRRDIFDPETVRAFAEGVGTPEHLKLLCLLTYADIQAVSPEALTPWKKEMLWQLYAATSNQLARTMDARRLHPPAEEAGQIARILRHTSEQVSAAEIHAFLEGFPKQYLLAWPLEEIAAHFKMARRLGEQPVQLEIVRHRQLYEVIVLTIDRPFLFASLAGVLAAWGMKIVKMVAFSNAAGIVLDTIRFVDLFRTFGLNPPELDRFKKSLRDVLTDRVSLDSLVRGRINAQGIPRPKLEVPTQLCFDNVSSSRSTILELIAQDRPGLLYQVSSTLAQLGCNIEVALIDTEGQKAIHVFYLTFRGAKLDLGQEQRLRDALLK